MKMLPDQGQGYVFQDAGQLIFVSLWSLHVKPAHSSPSVERPAHSCSGPFQLTLRWFLLDEGRPVKIKE